MTKSVEVYQKFFVGQQDVIKMLRQAVCNPHTSVMRAVILLSQRREQHRKTLQMKTEAAGTTSCRDLLAVRCKNEFF